ncbi:hypothetical protein TNCV_1562921 [Trichonephila clavipes]|nr:hypothetical protein TNCV_1562921 [Trichonephila clavipes]
MADLLPRNRVLPNTTSQRGDTSQVFPSMRSPSSALVAPFNRLIYSQILTRWYRSLSWHYFQDGDRFNSCQVIYSQFGLAIHQNDHQLSRRFVEWAQNEIAVVPDFHKRILFGDEAHFCLNGYVNKQNCHIWSEANPQVSRLFGIGVNDSDFIAIGIGSNPEEEIDVCKYVAPSRHGSTPESRRPISPVVRLLLGEDRWKAS